MDAVSSVFFLDDQSPLFASRVSVPESHFFDDPSEATEKFCQLFLQRYCGDGTAMAPPFATCSLDVALASSVGAPNVTEVSESVHLYTCFSVFSISCGPYKVIQALLQLQQLGFINVAGEPGCRRAVDNLKVYDEKVSRCVVYCT